MFRIFKSLGQGRLVFVDEAATLEDALARIKALAELWPGEYIIKNQDGEQVWPPSADFPELSRMCVPNSST